MSAYELNQILDRRLQMTPLSLADDARSAIVGISCGLPYYVQILGRFAAQNAIRGRRLFIYLGDVNAAVERFLIDSGGSFAAVYDTATVSARANSSLRDTLLASALATSDGSGFFKLPEVVRILNIITGNHSRNYVRAQRYISQLISRRRANVLIKRGIGGDYRYRFADATMQPFVIMKGIQNRLSEGGCRAFLSHWCKEEIDETGDRLVMAETHAEEAEQLASNCDNPGIVPPDPEDFPAAIAVAGEGRAAPPASSPGVAIEPKIIPTVVENAPEGSPVSHGWKASPKPPSKSIFRRFFG